MATPVFHINCYKEAKGRDASPKPAKWKGYCAHCGKRIFVGDMITWSRRTASTGTEGATSTADVEEEATAAEEQPKPEVSPTVSAGVLNWELMAEGLLPFLEGKFEVRGGAGFKPTVVEVRHPDGTTTDVGLQHRTFPTLLKAVSARVHVWLVGPAGSGKTTAGEKVAEALGLPFYMTGTVVDQYALSGYVNAHGAYVPSLFYKAYKEGGVFMLDDFDGSDPVAAVWLNGALANGYAPFPLGNNGEGGMTKKHDDFVCICSANTWGQGGTSEYVGRLKQDAAFLNRFCKIRWDYDADLELATCPDMAWCKRVQEVRKRVKDKGIKALITPRASYYGARLLAAGLDKSEVEAMLLASEMTPEQWATVC
jgi:cobaltochelatase CobS